MKEFLQNIVGLCLMRLLMEMALPEGDARRYADLGAGLCLMVCMLRALRQTLRGIV